MFTDLKGAGKDTGEQPSRFGSPQPVAKQLPEYTFTLHTW
ncbi:unnamed protein product [Amoebophrya sp. A25]|nr:unnamed protein product [Amoebophrya sp. A25]|eukprot:GSA25T00014964001.1